MGTKLSQKDAMIQHLKDFGSLDLVRYARKNNIPYSAIRGRMSEIRETYKDKWVIEKVNGVYFLNRNPLETKECKKVLKIFDRTYHTSFLGKLYDKFLDLFRN